MYSLPGRVCFMKNALGVSVGLIVFASSVAAFAAPGDGVQPGKWKTTVTISEAKIPGVPPAALARMQAKPMVDEDCITTDDVRSFIGQHAMSDDDDNCSTNTVTAAGGKVSGEAICTDDDGLKKTASVTGTYSATTIDLSLVIAGQTPKGPMSQKIHVAGARIGACKG
jgi:hypothetical protein